MNSTQVVFIRVDYQGNVSLTNFKTLTEEYDANFVVIVGKDKRLRIRKDRYAESKWCKAPISAKRAVLRALEHVLVAKGMLKAQQIYWANNSAAPKKKLR